MYHGGRSSGRWAWAGNLSYTRSDKKNDAFMPRIVYSEEIIKDQMIHKIIILDLQQEIMQRIRISPTRIKD